MIITVTGWTWDVVDNMTLPQVDELTHYWSLSPPIHILLASFMGVEKPKKQSETILGEDALRSLADQFNQH